MTPVRWRACLGLLALALVAFALYGAGLHTGEPVDPAADATEEPDRRIEVNITAIRCPEGYDNLAEDDVCLGYDGQIPGPTWVFAEGERVELTVHHRVAETLAALDEEPSQPLADKRYSLHRHGVSVAACEDGVARPVGTEVCESTVSPGQTVTYTFEAAFPGDWHYHDHALGLGVGTEHGEEAGPTAAHRGLWGSFLVLEEGRQPGAVLDLHLLAAGPNGGLGLNESVEAGERFDLLATGLGDEPWTLTLAGPEDDQLWRQELGPGVSRGYTVASAEPGAYTWTAFSPLSGTYEGEVVAQ